MSREVTIIGGGLAGSEAAWQAAERGIDVKLFEMRPVKQTGAHQTGYLAELVCSNSLGSKLKDRASGILMTELRHMGSLLLTCAEQVAVPAGSALAVDREAFAKIVTEKLTSHPRVTVVREEVESLPNGLVVAATGPLTSDAFAKELAVLTGEDQLYFFDALSPIVEAESIDMSVAFLASRYDRGQTKQGDYINCPLNKQEYDAFVEALLEAERTPLREFDTPLLDGVRTRPHQYFEGCLPVEIIAERGRDALAYGPMRPVGLVDPRTGRRPHAAVQLRQDDLAGSLYNLVGFQTNLMYGDQDRVFRMIPGLERVRFVRYGQMHRNTFINSPLVLLPSLQHRNNPHLLFAGQITGVEGYLGNIATGLLAGVNVVRLASFRDPLVLPPTMMLGALCRYITHAEADHFQPMKSNLGILPRLADDKIRNRRERAKAYAERSIEDLVKIWPLFGFNAHSH